MKVWLKRTIPKFNNLILVLILLSAFLIPITYDIANAIPAKAATTWYISTTGTDDAGHGTGIGTNAWATLDYAITGNHVAAGDRIEIQAGTYTAFNGAHTSIIPAVSGSGSTVTVAAYQNNAVILNAPANTNTSSAFFYWGTSNHTDLTFSHISFTNSGSINTYMFWMYGNNLTFNDCSITQDYAAGNMIGLGTGSATAANLTINRSTLTNSDVRVLRTDGLATVNVNSSLFKNCYVEADYGMTLNCYNNTFLKETTTVPGSIVVKNKSPILNIVNNIFYITNMGDTYVYPIYFTNSTAFDDLVSTNPNNWNATNNIWWRPTGKVDGLGFSVSTFTKFAGTQIRGLPINGTNHWLDPAFTNPASDYTIQAGSYCSGRGLTVNLPAGGDITGSAWTGKDVGCYKCPSATSPIHALQEKVAFAGDSIMRINSGNIYTQYTAITGITGVNCDDAATDGATITQNFFQLDTMMITVYPKYVFLDVGVNEITSATVYYGDSDYANKIKGCMQKIADWGAYPIWLGLGSLNGINFLDDARPLAINDLVEATCAANGWKYGSYLDIMITNHPATYQDASPNGYYDTVANVHPNAAGQLIIAQEAASLSLPTMTTQAFDGNYFKGTATNWAITGTTMYFQYGNTISYGQNTSAINSSISNYSTVIPVNLAGTYHYRSIAELGSQYGYGNDVQFDVNMGNSIGSTILKILGGLVFVGIIIIGALVAGNIILSGTIIIIGIILLAILIEILKIF